MRREVLIVLAGTMLFLSCKQKDQTAGKNGDPAEQTPEPATDSVYIRQTVTDFYEWYHTHYSSFFRFDLYSGLKKEDAPPYKINWEEIKKYQQFIRDSVPQLGQAFLDNQQRFFKQCDSAFKVDIEDEIPYGFDYDWYTNSQEGTEYLLEDIRNPSTAWEIRVNGDVADVRLTASRTFEGKTENYTAISLSLKKENGRWTISKIGNE